MTMAFTTRGSVVVVYHTRENPDDRGWTGMVRAMSAVLERHQVGAFLVYTEGGGPNAAQRRQLNSSYAPERVRSAVLTTSTVARGIVTAFSWIQGIQIRSFSHRELEQACEYLNAGVSPLVAESVIGTLRLRLGSARE